MQKIVVIAHTGIEYDYEATGLTIINCKNEDEMNLALVLTPLYEASSLKRFYSKIDAVWYGNSDNFYIKNNDMEIKELSLDEMITAIERDFTWLERHT